MTRRPRLVPTLAVLAVAGAAACAADVAAAPLPTAGCTVHSTGGVMRCSFVSRTGYIEADGGGKAYTVTVTWHGHSTVLAGGLVVLTTTVPKGATVTVTAHTAAGYAHDL